VLKIRSANNVEGTMVEKGWADEGWIEHNGICATLWLRIQHEFGSMASILPSWLRQISTNKAG
jgi:hypothetical protein